ncbi:MAG: hypothetical protein HDR03_12480 [Lachnospiraceae bacterium]|nr:hypothetical protein [Lachnospiraceae bacterium]
MKKGEIKPETRQKTESSQNKQEEVKKEEVEKMHEVEQNKDFFRCESEENAINQGCLQKTLSAETNKKAHVILCLIRKPDNRMCILEKEVVRRYVDTYSR